MQWRQLTFATLRGALLKLHLIRSGIVLAQGMIRRLHWVDTRDVLADGLTNGGIDGTLLHRASNDCKLKFAHQALSHNKIATSSATIDFGDARG